MSNHESECPLCLVPLEPYDLAHPIQCTSQHCHFNCCMSCLEQMIKATKDEHTAASDGNVFRVFLHCPNCRSNLGPSIRDTVLLRKVDKYHASQYLRTEDGVEVMDEQLSASELRFKYALKRDEDVASAIEGAQQREDEFFGRDFEINSNSFDDCLDLDVGLGKSLSGSFARKESVWSFDDEEGFEVDESGPHKSFIFRHHSLEARHNIDDDELSDFEDVKPDPTLLSGLDAFMTNQEQQFVTAQLISGDTTRLAASTEMMHYVSALSREGIKPSIKRQQSCLKRCPSLKRSMLESIKEVIREGNEARRLQEEREARISANVTVSQSQSSEAGRTLKSEGLAEVKRQQKMLADLETKQKMEYMRLYPLPLRMPKYAEATATHSTIPFGVTFLDDTWDGTVLDAFAKITVSTGLLGRVTVTKLHAESQGIDRIVNAMCGSGSAMSKNASPKWRSKKGNAYIDTESPRIIVASINREMGQQGIVRGDVVTHFNGEEFRGTASELTELIRCRYEGEVLTFVFNADAAVAEALKRRYMVISLYS